MLMFRSSWNSLTRLDRPNDFIFSRFDDGNDVLRSLFQAVSNPHIQEVQACPFDIREVTFGRSPILTDDEVVIFKLVDAYVMLLVIIHEFNENDMLIQERLLHRNSSSGLCHSR